MTYTLSLAAAFGCAVCNGVAAILQKVSADREDNVKGLDAGLMLKLVKDLPYLIGVMLDVSGWILTFIAVRYLPLFLVESIIAANIAVTAIIERFLLRKPLPGTAYITIGFMLLGLVLVAISAAPASAGTLSLAETCVLFVIVAVVILAGAFFAKNSSPRSATILAGLAGISFGLTSVASRVFRPAHPLWHNLYNPYISILIIAGTLGIFLFSVALQRAHATVLNASMTATQTLIPALIGIVLLEDKARAGHWVYVILGTSITTGAAILLALQYNPKLRGRHAINKA
jgi:drug/metabolite transporter (DMT)-like permease